MNARLCLPGREIGWRFALDCVAYTTEYILKRYLADAVPELGIRLGVDCRILAMGK